MKIKYVHIADPDNVKIHDTKRSFKGCIGMVHALGSNPTQSEWDKQELERFESDRAKGRILWYEVVEEQEKKENG